MRHSMARMFVVLIAVVLLSTGVGAGAARAQATGSTTAPQGDTTYEKAVDVVQPGVVRLQIGWHAYVDTGPSDLGKVGPYDFTASCTGFIVNPSGYIVTAGHCVDPSLEGIGSDVLTALVKDMVAADIISAADAQNSSFLQYAIQNWHIEGEAANSPADISVTVAHGIALSGKSQLEDGPARVIEANPPSKGDVALLKVEAADLPTLLLADAAGAGVGTSVLSVGYPASSDQVTDPSMTATFKDGKVSSQKTREGGLIPVYEVSAALSKGMSGGPTVTLDGKVIGLNSFYPSDETQPFNFLSPSTLISETLTRNGVKNELGAVDKTYREGLDAYYSGDYATAEKRFASTLEQVPAFQQAQKLKTLAAAKAAANPTTPPTSAAPAAPVTTATATAPSSSTWLIGGGVLAVVLVLGVVAIFALGRNKRTGSTPAAPAAPVGPAPAPPYGMPSAPPPSAPSGPPMPTAYPTPAGSAAAMTPGAPAATMTAEQPTAVPDSFCGHCGHAVPGDDQFCPSCGNDMHRVH